MSERERIAEMRAEVIPHYVRHEPLGEALDGWQRALDERDEAQRIAAALVADNAAVSAALAKAQGEAALLREALIWCSGSDDFQEGGKARAGWLKVRALLDGSAPLAEAAARVIADAKTVRCFIVAGAAPAPGIVEATVWLYLDRIIGSVDALLALERQP